MATRRYSNFGTAPFNRVLREQVGNKVARMAKARRMRNGVAAGATVS